MKGLAVVRYRTDSCFGICYHGRGKRHVGEQCCLVLAIVDDEPEIVNQSLGSRQARNTAVYVQLLEDHYVAESYYGIRSRVARI